ncbi:MAG: transcriptional activator, partial [Chthonomonadales bacterium]|nr:transcriptional activator [Chthonomonadales bacterium]
MIYRITIELLGHLAVRHAEDEVTRFRTQKTAVLLAYLACFPHRSHAREELMEMLWPDVEMEAARGSLRTALASLRRQIEPPDAPENSVIVADRQIVRLNPETVTTDVNLFETALLRARRSEDPHHKGEALSTAVDLYRG